MKWSLIVPGIALFGGRRRLESSRESEGARRERREEVAAEAVYRRRQIMESSHWVRCKKGVSDGGGFAMQKEWMMMIKDWLGRTREVGSWPENGWPALQKIYLELI